MIVYNSKMCTLHPAYSIDKNKNTGSKDFGDSSRFEGILYQTGDGDGF